jgi:hypothetical protein
LIKLSQKNQFLIIFLLKGLGDHQKQPESPHALVLPKDPRERMATMHETPSSEKSAAPHPRSTVEATEMAVEKAMSDALI